MGLTSVPPSMERDIYQNYMINTLNPILNAEKVYGLAHSWEVKDKYKDIEVLAEEKAQQERDYKRLVEINLSIGDGL